MSAPDENQIKQIISEQAMKQPNPDKMKVTKIELRKKTLKELEEMATARSKDDKDTDEEEANLPVPHVCPSEYSLKELNNQLIPLPIVRAFNSAEGKIRKKQ
ncbi:unnamed protein product [Caenorhabditis angaria]|uniref:Uncharacterized protein n=1 Tax=Caenorhabditis angaria TaxID=860376 RepID=A0A9P1I6Q2_9PELO|nr:unnamed protein product [Caenorhabditis angaria]